MLKDKLAATLFIVMIIGLMVGMFTYKDNRPIQDFLTEYRNTVVEGTPLIYRVYGAIDAAETIMIRDTYRRSDFNELFGLTQKLLGKNILQDPNYGQIYKTTEDQIIFSVAKKEVKPAIDSLAELKKELDVIGVPLLYVQAPFKVSDKEQTLPAGIQDYADKNADEFLEGLKAEGIDFLDLRPLLRDGEKSQKELFYDTDHHWRIETAFEATWHIGRALNQKYGFQIEDKYMSLDAYNVKIFKDFFQGSMGRRVGSVYGGIDDFTLITPKFSTDLSVEQRDENQETFYTGDFEQSMLVLDNIDANRPVDTNRYAVYRGDNGELVFKNNMDAYGKVMMIKDSFALPVYSFLAPAIKETSALDMRYFHENVVEYTKKTKPDVLIVLYNGDSFTEEMFDFNLNQGEKND